MATGADAIILSALLEHLGTLTFTPALQIAMPGIDFPAAGQAKPGNYLQASFLPNDTTNTELGAGQEQHRGIMQVSVYWKNGVGLIKPLEAADRIIDHFAKETKLYKDGLKIVIDRKPYAAPPLQETDRVHVPVTVRYHAFS
ncbi:phage tail terminator-like protein [Rhizobium alvei]|uniref:Phage tail terminator-like protein n=1 Tax=Rhizobium alvei TaxID=1132659 RepID=A0ABT8YVF2_9HYPH|nr:phage tail terminator-like protein [Rhizobium alvei]MDO6966985.1 phage tail terminator-like protein [Rhizobium alvei]